MISLGPHDDHSSQCSRYRGVSKSRASAAAPPRGVTSPAPSSKLQLPCLCPHLTPASVVRLHASGPGNRLSNTPTGLLSNPARNIPLKPWTQPGCSTSPALFGVIVKVQATQPTNSVQFLSNYQWHFSQNQNNNNKKPKFVKDTQKTLNSQSNLGKEKRTWRNQIS